MNWAYIDQTDDSWDGVEHASEEAPEGYYANEIPPNYASGGCLWSPVGKGWKDVVTVSRLIPVGRFKLLLTQSERIGFRTSAGTDPEVADALDLLNGFTNGISLDDPVLAGFLAQMVGKELLAAERVAAILAGDAPD